REPGAGRATLADPPDHTRDSQLIQTNIHRHMMKSAMRWRNSRAAERYVFRACHAWRPRSVALGRSTEAIKVVGGQESSRADPPGRVSRWTTHLPIDRTPSIPAGHHPAHRVWVNRNRLVRARSPSVLSA